MSYARFSAPRNPMRAIAASATQDTTTYRREKTPYVNADRDTLLASKLGYDWREVMESYQRRAAYI
jgi:hypothetical protein